MGLDELLNRRAELLSSARARVPGVRITENSLSGDEATDRASLVIEIDELREFVERQTPGLHTDTEDTAEEEVDW
jgi:hypothetical protein